MNRAAIGETPGRLSGRDAGAERRGVLPTVLDLLDAGVRRESGSGSAGPVAGCGAGTTVRFVLHGEPASKGNSRQIVIVRGKPMLIKSPKAREYARAALLQIPRAARVNFSVPVRVTMRIWYGSERPDLDESLILDVLQAEFAGEGKNRRVVRDGVYLNDRLVRERHIYHGIDRANPRAEIEVEPIA